jgi:hypothetical protein
MASYDEAWSPTFKAHSKKEEGLSLIKDQLLKQKVVVSDRCEKLAWEVENYLKDKNGKVPKGNDHLIDCWRYANAYCGVTFLPEDIPEEIPRDDMRRGYALGKESFEDEEDLVIDTKLEYWE